MKHPTPYTLALLVLFILIAAWSGWHPKDNFIWWLEVFPALIGAGLLVATYRQFSFTPLSYTLVLLHSSILFIGGHYTYAEMPLFTWLKEVLDLSRNHFDRVGHIAQGFIPVMLCRELLWRTSPLKTSPRWLFFLCLSVAMAISAWYELLEWQVSVWSGSRADEFLALQGDIWDTQWDMALAGFGATAALLLLGRWQTRQILEMENKATAASQNQ